MRLFIAVPLADTVIAEVSSLIAQLASSAGGLRWSTPETWHITLQFLGKTTEEQYSCVVTRLREIRSPTVPVQLEGVGFFDRAGIFFAGVNTSPELVELQQRVTTATGPCGFIPETRLYHPHITLARSKAGSKGLRELKNKVAHGPSFTKFVAEEFRLYESFTLPAGSQYQIRERFPLTLG